MPEVWFTLRWPDETEEKCYSPSTAITDHLHAGQTYPLPDFHERARNGLLSASDRVEQVYGRPCSRALGQLEQIETKVKNFEKQDDPKVICLNMSA